jgi:hypothetical protein
MNLGPDIDSRSVEIDQAQFRTPFGVPVGTTRP